MTRIWLAVALAIAATVAWWAAVPTPAAHADNQLFLPDGGSSAILGPNSVLRIDGRLNYSTDCAGGIDDFVYPASDVYVVESGFTGGALSDVGAMPNTIVQGGSMFEGQVIAITAPSGELGAGRYSIVFDTCQDQHFDPAQDTVFTDAITVVLPPVLPSIDASIRTVKTNARNEWGSWSQVMRALEAYENLQKAENAIECITGDAGACAELFEIIDANPGMTYVMAGTKRLVANMIASFGAIYADPPRADFTTPSSAVVGVDQTTVVAGAGAATEVLSELTTALQREVALRDALLAAVERYQGAQAAGDPPAAVAQLRTAAGLAALLADTGAVSVGLLGDYVASLDALGVDQISQRRLNSLGRYRLGGGLTAAEDRLLRNQGIEGQDRAAFFDLTLRIGRATSLVLPVQWLEDEMARIQGHQAAGAAALDTMAAELLDVAATITGAGPDLVPSIVLPSRFSASAGAPAEIAATASEGSVVTWDLDADGVFDDGTGPSATAVFAAPGHRVIAARATTAGNRSVVAHALVDVAAANLPPSITAATPAGGPLVAGTVGAPTTFAIEAADPTSDPLSYAWHVDGVTVAGATGAELTLTPAAGERGHHVVAVTVADGHPGNSAARAWSWSVADVDTDGDGWSANQHADCDDANGNIHPGLAERMYNGVDDDCDSATPDQPLELAIGQLWGWGTGDGAPGTGSNVSTAVPRYQNVDRVAQAVGLHGAGALLDDDGAVWAWGSSVAVLGDGNPNPHSVYTPQPVVPPGWAGGEGQLGGITALTSASYWVGALTSEGRVLTWGQNYALGQGFNGTQQPLTAIPGYVVDGAAPGGRPIENVVAIEGGYHAGYAILDDGSAVTWGRRFCVGGNQGVPRSDWAVASPHLSVPGTTIMQIEGGNLSFLVRHSDGTVSWCRDNNELPQRLSLDTFAGQRAVDLATVGNGIGAFVLTEDGSLWVSGDPTAFQIEPLITESPVDRSTWTRVLLPDRGQPGKKVIALDGQDVPCAIFAIREDGTAASWGDFNRNCHGQGDGTVVSSGNHATPGQLAIPGVVRDISGGGYSTVAVVGREGADVWTWGSDGVLGRPGPTGRGQTPAPIPGLTNVVELVATGDPGAQWALKADGSVVGWTSGQPGTWYFTATSNSTVQAVKGVGGQGALTGVTHLASGLGVVAALRNDGRVVTWGFGAAALGGGAAAPTNRHHPDFVVGADGAPIADVEAVWGGASGFVARQRDGTLLQWGRRDCAGFGVGDAASTVDVATPIPPGTNWPADLVQYASDSRPDPVGIARRADGSVLTCGEVSGEHALRAVPGFGPDRPAIDVAAAAGPAWWVVTASGGVWVKTTSSSVQQGLGIAGDAWTEIGLPAGAFATGVTANDGSAQIRLADGSLLTVGINMQYQLGRGPSDPPGSDDWELRAAHLDGFVLDSVVEGWNAAALVLPGTTVDRAGWVPPQLGVAVTAVGASGPEGGSATASIELSQPAAIDLEVGWTFNGAAGTTVVAAGHTSAPIPLVLPPRDGVWALERTLPLTLTVVDRGARLDGELAEIVVLDVDVPPTLTIAPASVAEGDGALTAHSVTVALSHPAGIDLPLTVASIDGTALSGASGTVDADFATLDLDALVPAGQTAVTVPLVVFGNRAPQPNRTLTVSVASGNVDVATVTAPLTIVDDDPVTLQVVATIADAGAPATVTLRVPSLPPGESVEVRWATSDASAVAPTDYDAVSGTVVLVAEPPQTLRGLQGVPGLPGLTTTAAATATISLATHLNPSNRDALRYLLLDLSMTSAGRRVLGSPSVAVGIRQVATTDETVVDTTPASTTPPSTTPPSTTPATSTPASNVATSTTAPRPSPPGTTPAYLPATGTDVTTLPLIAAAFVLAGSLLTIRRRGPRTGP